MNKPTADNTYLVISRGQWDEDAREDQVQVAIDQFYGWYEKNLESGRMLPGSRLQAQGRLVSRHRVIDGPFAEAKELIGGYWFIVAASLDEAAALAAENPCLAFGLALEVRPLEAEKALASVPMTETPSAWRTRKT